MTVLAPTLQAFFTERLITQRHASPHTVAAYKDTFRLLLGFAESQTRKTPSRLEIEDLHAGFIGAFLDHLETDRANSVSTRNARLAAIHSLFRYAALRHPEHAALIERVLAIPPKRFERHTVAFLTDTEVDALLAAPDRATWLDRRDHALLLTAIQTGLRVSELANLRHEDLTLGTGAHIRCVGKGRKETGHPAHLHHRRGAASLADRDASDPHRPTLRHHLRPAAQPLRHRRHHRPPHLHRNRVLSDPGHQNCLRSHSSTLWERLGYVAGRGVSVDGLAGRADSGHITRVRYWQMWSSHSSRS